MKSEPVVRRLTFQALSGSVILMEVNYLKVRELLAKF